MGKQAICSNLGSIVHPNYRGMNFAKLIKAASFRLARLRWPKAKIFRVTSGAAVMKMNTELGYVPVTFNELTDDEAFWKGCEGCINTIYSWQRTVSSVFVQPCFTIRLCTKKTLFNKLKIKN